MGLLTNIKNTFLIRNPKDKYNIFQLVIFINTKTTNVEM